MSDWFYRLIRWTLGFIFLYSGCAKLFDPQVFAVLIEAFGLVPEILVMPIAVFLPTLEVMVSLGLLFDIRGSLATTAGLMILFMTILIYGIHMGFDIDCGCFGQGDLEAAAFHGLRIALYRDMLIMAGIVYLYIWRRKKSIKPVGLKYGFNNLLKIKGVFYNATH